jgi:hypothetical protein
MQRIENTARAKGAYWAGLCGAIVLLYASDNPLRDSLPIGFTTYGQEIEFNREYYSALVGEYRARASDLELELEATKAEACIKYEIEAFCFHRDGDMRYKWEQWYEQEAR